MVLYTSLFEFKTKFVKSADVVSQLFESIFQKYNLELTLEKKNDHFLQFCSKDCFAVVRILDDHLITLDLQEVVKYNDQPKCSNQISNSLKVDVEKALECEHCQCLPIIRRGGSFNCYFPTTDNKFIEYDFEDLIFHEKSEFQDVKIYKSHQYGNMLILDDDPNLAESDLAYTQAITGNGREIYTDKTVLILGGGDGGILNELRKQKPKFITMVDIDKVVVDGARKHLRGICGDSLDTLTSHNYEVLIEDCIPVLNKYANNGKLFDYVINDLTAIPVTTKPVGEMWDFMRLILELSMSVLSPDGKYFTQGNGFNNVNALKMYEDQLKLLKTPVNFRKEPICVPSYHEMWVFYEITKI